MKSHVSKGMNKLSKNVAILSNTLATMCHMVTKEWYNMDQL